MLSLPGRIRTEGQMDIESIKRTIKKEI